MFKPSDKPCDYAAARGTFKGEERRLVWPLPADLSVALMAFRAMHLFQEFERAQPQLRTPVVVPSAPSERQLFVMEIILPPRCSFFVLLFPSKMLWFNPLGLIFDKEPSMT